LFSPTNKKPSLNDRISNLILIWEINLEFNGKSTYYFEVTLKEDA